VRVRGRLRKWPLIKFVEFKCGLFASLKTAALSITDLASRAEHWLIQVCRDAGIPHAVRLRLGLLIFNRQLTNESSVDFAGLKVRVEASTHFETSTYCVAP